MVLCNKGRYKRTLLTLFGKVEFTRTLLVVYNRNAILAARAEPEDKRIEGIYPLDDYLGITDIPFKMTPRLMSAVAKEAVMASSYNRAAKTIRERYGFTISSDTVRLVTNHVGQMVFDDDTARAELALQQHNAKFDRRTIHKSENDILYLEMDGAHVNTRVKVDGSSWTECKIAIAFLSEDLHEWVSKEGELKRSITKKRLIGYVGNCHVFKKYVLCMMERYDYKRRNTIVVISDGADWIHKIILELFPNAIHILDLCHVKEHIGDYGKGIIEDKDEASKWIDECISLVVSADLEGVENMLAPYKNKAVNGTNLLNYITGHWECMNYPLYKEKGYFLGSGASESANKYTMQNRMKLQGMRWTRTSAQLMLSLKAKLESDSWDEVVSLVDNEYLL